MSVDYARRRSIVALHCVRGFVQHIRFSANRPATQVSTTYPQRFGHISPQNATLLVFSEVSCGYSFDTTCCPPFIATLI